jgi:protein-L-isoaspartate(D-aspartate) O-methyltransferase
LSPAEAAYINPQNFRSAGLTTRSPLARSAAAAASDPSQDMSDYAKIRTNMVESQLRPNKVNTPALIDAFLAVPREAFVPPSLKGAAYVDDDVPLGGGRTLLEPMVFARLLQSAAIGPGDVVLEIGCTTGYGAAILARLAKSVIAIDCDPALLRQATANLAGLRNIVLFEGQLDKGYPERAPYDVIVIGGTVAEIPPALIDQMAEGGRLVTVVETRAGQLGEAVLLQRGPDGIVRRRLFEAAAHVLPGFQREPSFAF